MSARRIADEFLPCVLQGACRWRLTSAERPYECCSGAASIYLIKIDAQSASLPANRPSAARRLVRGDEAVETELASSNLCGALDFSKVDDVCGRLETRDVLLKKAAHDARCAHRGPGATPRIELSEGLFSRLRGA